MSQRKGDAETRDTASPGYAPRGPFDLGSEREPGVRRFRMITSHSRFGPEGKRLGGESYTFDLSYALNPPPHANTALCTVTEFQLQLDDGPLLTIPQLENWTYEFNPSSGMDGRSPLWGIPQEKFASLDDSSGKSLPFAVRYAVYNNFIDFHSINDAFTRPIPFGKGVQDLKEIGQRVVHPASFIEAPIRFGAEVNPGSTFRNGEISLELKGVSVVDGAACALLAYDAGQSKLRFLVPVSPNRQGVTEGLSMYKGDIYVDIATRWVRRATLDEYMTQQTTVTEETSMNDEFTVRHVVLHLIA